MRLIPALLLSLSLILLPTAAFASHTASPTVSAGLAKNRVRVNISFWGLRNAASIKYQLTYDSSRGPQVAGGTIKVGRRAKRISRSPYLGTCSGRACVAHPGVRNIKLSVDFTLRSGGIISYEKKL